MMEQLTVSLDAEFSQQDTGDVFLAEDNVNNSVPVERRKRIPSKALKRLGIISTTLSSSEPGKFIHVLKCCSSRTSLFWTDNIVS